MFLKESWLSGKPFMSWFECMFRIIIRLKKRPATHFHIFVFENLGISKSTWGHALNNNNNNTKLGVSIRLFSQGFSSFLLEKNENIP